MAMLLFKPLLTISNNNSSSSCSGRNSLPSRRHVCMNFSPPSGIPFGYTHKLLSISNNNNSSSSSSSYVCKNSSSDSPSSAMIFYTLKPDKFLLRRFSGTIDDNPYYTTLSTTTDSDVKGCCSPIIHHNDYISLPFSETLDYHHINFLVGSCDGLVCLSDAGRRGYAALWNPSTNDYKILPETSVPYPPSAAYSKFPSVGFGFDPKSQDYKMVRFVRFTFETEEGYYGHTEHHVEVYSLKTDSWREVNPPHCLCDLGAITIDGRCYWGALSPSSFVILCFDFSTEEFLPLIPLPDAVKGGNMLHTLEFDGSLALLNCNVSIGGEYNVWVLDHSTSTWSHVSVIRHSSRNTKPIGFMGNDKLLFENTQERQLLVYDCVAREMKSLGIYEDEEQVLQTLHYNSNSAADNYSALLLNGKKSAAE